MHRSISVSGAAGILVAALAASVHGQPATALLKENGPLPGVPGETVASVNNVAVNHVGGYAISLNSTGSGTTLSRAFGNATGGVGAVLQTEGTIGDLEQTSFESFIGLSDAGLVAYSAISNDTSGGFNGLDGAWLGDTVVLNERDPVSSLPGQFSVFNSRVGVTGDGKPWWVGGITNVQGGATQNRVLFLGEDLIPVLKGGDSVGGIVEPVSPASGPDFDSSFSADGSNYIAPVTLSSASAIDRAVVINGSVATAGGGIVREGSPVPPAAGGLPGELWVNFDEVGITDSGTWFLTGNSSAAISQDEFVVVDGQVVLREGESLGTDLGSATISGAIESGYMNEDGDWAVTWDVNIVAGNVEALILNGGLLLLEGDPVDWDGDGMITAADDGATITDFTGIANLAVGDRIGGQIRIYFTADVTLDSAPVTEAFFCITVPVVDCPEDLSGNGQVDFADILAVIGAWGPCAGCPEDLSGNNQVDFADILIVIGAWGPCP